MRQFINIIEDVQSLGMPDLSQFTTDAFVDELLARGMWTSHGSELSTWWDEGAPDYMTPEEIKPFLAGEDQNADLLPDLETMKREDPALVKRTLKKFLIARMGYIAQMMNGQLYDMMPITAETEIRRRMMVDEKYLRQLPEYHHATIPLGIYWGSEEVEPWGASYEDSVKNAPYCIEFTTQIKYVEVNWKETIMSRVDWSLGDDENEIQLVKGSAIRGVDRVEVVTSNADRTWIGKFIEIDPTVQFIA